MTAEQEPVNEQNADNAAASQAEQEQPTAQQEAAEASPGQEAEQSDQDLAAELAKAQSTIKDYWDQIVRLNAEIENNRKRAQRDIENAHKYAVKNFVESLLPVTDSMELGLDASGNENADLETIKQGMNMTLDLFLQTLDKNGISRLDPLGEKFNPEHHQAMTMQEQEDVEPNTVISVMQKGYLLNDRLIRPAMVVVSKAKSS